MTEPRSSHPGHEEVAAIVPGAYANRYLEARMSGIPQWSPFPGTLDLQLSRRRAWIAARRRELCAVDVFGIPVCSPDRIEQEGWLAWQRLKPAERQRIAEGKDNAA